MSKLLTCTSTNRPKDPHNGDAWFETDTQSIIVYGGASAGWITYGLENFKRNQEITIDPVPVLGYSNSYDVVLDVESSSGLQVFFSSSDESVVNLAYPSISMRSIYSRVNGTSTANLVLEVVPFDFEELNIEKKLYAKINNVTGRDAQDINGDWIPVRIVGDTVGGKYSFLEVMNSFNKEIDEIEDADLEVVNAFLIYGMGETTITASQPGNEEYLPAEPIETIVKIPFPPEWVVKDEGVPQYSLSNPSDIAYDTLINDGGDPGQITYTLTSAANNSSGSSILLLNPEQGTLSFTRAPDVNAGETGFYVIITATNIAGSDDKAMFIEVIE